jgi:inosose dehydratase
MMLKIATAPGSWGVEPPGDPADPPWREVLDDIAAAGFEGVELGPVGYLPEQPAQLRAALSARALELAAGYVMAPFHRKASRLDVLATARRTCRALAGGGARCVVLIEALEPARSAAAGRAHAAPRLDARGWTALVDTVQEVAQLAAETFGLAAVFHPHAGTYVEHADEIDRLLAETDPELVGLCVDTGHAHYAGHDPADLVRAHAERLRHVHLKDVRADLLELSRQRRLTFERAVAAGVFCPLGDGAVDLTAFGLALDDVGYDGWATFEQDRLLGDPRARPDAQASLAHLRSIGIAGERESAAERNSA